MDRHHRQVDHDDQDDEQDDRQDDGQDDRQDDGQDDGREPGGEGKVEAFSADVGILVPTKATEVERLP